MSDPVPTPSSRAATLPALILATAVAIGLVKLPYGMFWPDEGFYLTSSYRLLLGDLPFRDELSYASSWFFLVLTPLLALLPEGGTVVQVRLAGFAIRLGAAAALFATFRRTLPAPLRAAALAVTLLANYPSLLVPNYNGLPFDLGFLSLSCWIAGLRSATSARAWGAAGGILLGLSCLCYLPRLPLLAIPVGAAFWAARRHHITLRSSGWAMVAGAAAVFAAAGAWLAGAGLWADVVDGVRFQAESRLFAPDPLLRFDRLVKVEITRAVPGAALHLLFGGTGLVLAAAFARRRTRARAAALATVVVAYAAAVTGVYLRYGDRSVPAYAFVYSGLCWLPLFLSPLLRRRLSGYAPDVRVEAGLLFWMAAGPQAVAAWTSTQVAAAGIPGLAASLLLLLLLWHAPRPAADAGRPPTRPSPAPVYGFAAALAVTAALFHFYPGQSPWRVRTEAFAGGRLDGLRTNRRSVRAWTRIVDYLRPKLQRGEPLLAYGNIPLLHYLTDTRPALRASYVAPFMYDGAQQARLVEAMVRAGRVPRYAVRLMAAPADEYVSPSYSERREVDPINVFVQENYELEARVPPFEVFRRRSAR